MDAMWMPASPILRLAWLKRLSGGGGGVPVYKTISGNPVTFSAVAAPLQQLRVDFSPVQAGSGTPATDNVRLISGWTGLTATVNGSAVPVSWETEAGTVYGGYVDLITGELVAEYALYTFDGTLDYRFNSTFEFVYRNVPLMRAGEYSTDPFVLCDRAKKVESSGSTNNLELKVGNNSKAAFLYNLNRVGVTTEEEMRAFLDENPVSFTYPLATPIHYQLTSQTIRTIRGSNTISSDGGSMTVTYRES